MEHGKIPYHFVEIFQAFYDGMSRRNACLYEKFHPDGRGKFGKSLNHCPTVTSSRFFNLQMVSTLMSNDCGSAFLLNIDDSQISKKNTNVVMRVNIFQLIMISSK